MVLNHFLETDRGAIVSCSRLPPEMPWLGPVNNYFMSATATIWPWDAKSRARFARWQISEGAPMARGQIVPSLRVVFKIATGCVARLAHILDMGRGKRLATDDFEHNASHEVIVNRP